MMWRPEFKAKPLCKKVYPFGSRWTFRAKALKSGYPKLAKILTESPYPTKHAPWLKIPEGY